MTFLDWTILVVWLGITLSGFWKGAVRIVFGVGGLMAGLWLAVIAGPEVELMLGSVVGVDWVATALARLLPVVACLILCLVAGWGIEKTLNALHLGWLNRLAGAALAGMVGVALLAILVGTAARLSPSWDSWTSGSVLVPRLEAVWSVVAGPQPDPAAVSDDSKAEAGEGIESDAEPTTR